jgi:hypothetical protein
MKSSTVNHNQVHNHVAAGSVEERMIRFRDRLARGLAGGGASAGEYAAPRMLL